MSAKLERLARYDASTTKAEATDLVCPPAALGIACKRCQWLAARAIVMGRWQVSDYVFQKAVWIYVDIRDGIEDMPKHHDGC